MHKFCLGGHWLLHCRWESIVERICLACAPLSSFAQASWDFVCSPAPQGAAWPFHFKTAFTVCLASDVSLTGEASFGCSYNRWSMLPGTRLFCIVLFGCSAIVWRNNKLIAYLQNSKHQCWMLCCTSGLLGENWSALHGRTVGMKGHLEPVALRRWVGPSGRGWQLSWGVCCSRVWSSLCLDPVLDVKVSQGGYWPKGFAYQAT